MASKITFGLLFVAVIACSFVGATEVEQCSTAEHGRLVAVNIAKCRASPCNIVKGSEVPIKIRFVPDNEVDHSRVHVHSKVSGVRLPFLAANDHHFCDNIYHADEETPAQCPLETDVEYVYKNTFKIPHHVPSMRVDYSWALQDVGDNNDVVCFQWHADLIDKEGGSSSSSSSSSSSD